MYYIMPSPACQGLFENFRKIPEFFSSPAANAVRGVSDPCEKRKNGAKIFFTLSCDTGTTYVARFRENRTKMSDAN